MLNRTPTNTSNTINAYRKKRQQKGPFLMYGAIALVVIGFILLVVWMTKTRPPLGNTSQQILHLQCYTCEHIHAHNAASI
jgi:predicted nucleic acid-binding Zn ribbon protein